ncbi:MAG: hypothetical protein IPK73_26925 [Candidatus Obscuribacter sp.]|nr:hypothetical protein [Candidatus Obscuribacter sp.]MBK9277758.1 hypothetical protein [Candidatus Obscuribacter sp.]
MKFQNPISKLNTWLQETIAEAFESGQFRIKDFSANMSGRSLSPEQESDFARRERLIRQWLNADQYDIHIGKKHPEYAHHLSLLGDLYAVEMWPAMGLPHYEKALAIYKLTLPAHDSRCLVLLGKIARCYEASGRLLKAEPLYWQIADQILNGDYPLSEKEKAASDLIDILSEQGKHEETLALQLQLVGFYEETLFRDLEGLVRVYERTAAVFKAMHDPTTAAKYRNLSLALISWQIVQKALGQDAYSLRQDLARVQDCYLSLNKEDLAEKLRRHIKLITVKERTSKDDYPGLEEDLNMLADLYEERAAETNSAGDNTVAQHLRLKVLRIKEKRTNSRWTAK